MFVAPSVRASVHEININQKINARCYDAHPMFVRKPFDCRLFCATCRKQLHFTSPIVRFFTGVVVANGATRRADGHGKVRFALRHRRTSVFLLSGPLTRQMVWIRHRSLWAGSCFPTPFIQGWQHCLRFRTASEQGGADGRRRSFGVGGAEGVINTPSVFNSDLNFVQFWDGRAAAQEQAGPLHNPLDAPSWRRCCPVW